jgi:Holliday junction resolvase
MSAATQAEAVPMGAASRRLGGAAAKRKGTRAEYRVRRELEQHGWVVTRAGGSLGVADLVALKAGETPRLIQSKCGLPAYKNFSPAERLALRVVADKAGAEPWLCVVADRAPLRWIPSVEWPKDARADTQG